MEHNNPEHYLTSEDFHCPGNWLPYNFFACPDCAINTNCITRHPKWAYIAEFRCTSGVSSCRQFKSWYKCRLCTQKNKAHKQAGQHLRNTNEHKQNLLLFEQSKSSEYIQREFQFTCESQPIVGATSQIDTQSSSAENTQTGNEATTMHLEEEATSTGGFSQSFTDDSSNQDGEPGPIPRPQTVKEWKKLVFANSRSLSSQNMRIDLSSYFPTRGEPTPVRGYVRSPWSLEYYEENMAHAGGGPRLLTAKAVVGNAAAADMVRPKSALWCVLLSKLSDKLTLAEQQILIALFDHMKQKGQEESGSISVDAHGQPLLSLPIPATHRELRRKFISGRSALPELIPRPVPIRILGNGFVYVSIRSVLQYHLANCQPLDPLVDLPYTGKPSPHAVHGSSPRGRELLSLTAKEDREEDVQSPRYFPDLPTAKFPSYITIWSDGFEPNANVRNKGSVHVMLVSIGTPQDDYHSGRNTYAVSIGPASGDTESVARLVADELAELFREHWVENVFFHGETTTELSIFLRVFAILQDRPERCHWLRLTAGNGIYGARFGWASDLSSKDTIKFLPSCKKCNKSRLKRPICINEEQGRETTIRTRRCKKRKCADWCMSDVLFEIPEDYPKVFKSENARIQGDLPPTAPIDPREDGKYLRCHRISVVTLKLACLGAFDMVRLGKWKKKEGKAYLETQGISPEFCLQICEAAEASYKTGLDQQMPELPASWSIPGLDVCHHIDVPMHLCFLGIGKSNYSELIKGWLKSKRQSKSFHRKRTPLLTKIKKLSLSWCKVETRTGGYISENWLAYTRISKRIYQPLEHLETSDVLYEDPAKPLSQYTWKEKKAWLLARKIPDIKARTLKKDIIAEFDKFLSLPEGSEMPPIVRPVASKATVEVVNHLIVSWHVCISRIMSLVQHPSEAQVLDIERHIKLFLTAVERFDCSRREGEATEQRRAKNAKSAKRQKTEPAAIAPVWRRKPNYLGLLNYPDTIREMGPIRRLTELDLKGEAAIKHIKSKIKVGLKGNWAYNAMLNYYKERSFQFVLKDCLEDIGEEYESGDLMIQTARRLAGNAINGKEVDSSSGEGDSDSTSDDEDSDSSSDDEDSDATSDEEETDDDEDSEEKKPAAVKRHKPYQHFKESEDALASLDGEEPISGLIWKKRFYLVIKGAGSTSSVVEIRPAEFHERYCGADYFYWEQLDSANDSREVTKMISGSREFFLLLPHMDPGATDGDDFVSFYLVSSEWKEVFKSDDTEEGFAFDLPRIPGASY